MGWRGARYLRLDRDPKVKVCLETRLKQWQFAALLITGSCLSFTLSITEQEGNCIETLGITGGRIYGGLTFFHLFTF